jgi:hypothetical protein
MAAEIVSFEILSFDMAPSSAPRWPLMMRLG